jgi:diguanylate cyclase (GGDEF)-like protein/PAS domain S-box-containing protein
MEDCAGPIIGVVSPYVAGYYFGSLISGVQGVVSGRGGRVIAISTSSLGADYVRGVPRGQLPPLAWDRVAGFVAIANAVPAEYLHELERGGKPVVTLGYRQDGLACPAVVTDNRGGVRRSVDHLVEHGHTRIAFAGNLDRFDVQERYAAYQEALAAHGLEGHPGWFYPTPDSLEPGGRAAARAMVEAGLPCTAVVAGNDWNAVGILAGLKQAGLRLPRDQAVTGFDDLPGMSVMSPSLSTVAQDFGRLAQRAAHLLLDRVAGEDVPPFTHLVEAVFIGRESCGCVTAAPPSREAGWPPAGDAVAAELARVVDNTFARAAEHPLPALELFELGQACTDLYARHPSPSTYDDVLARAGVLVQALTGGTGGAAGTSGTGGTERAGGAEARLERCLAEVRLGLSRALLNERNEAFYDLRQAVRDEHVISMDLLRGHKEDPRSLSWLARTDAIAAVLGLWQGPRAGAEADGQVPGDAQLEVGGTFAVDGELAIGPCSYATRCFPPRGLYDRAGPGDVVLVFPVRNQDRYWGLLSVVVPVNWSFLNRETVFQWENLLCEALSYQDVVRDLNHRSGQLAKSAERERRMSQVAKESEERYALAARAANDGLWDWDLMTGSIFYSARWKRLLGYPAHQVGASPQEWLGRVHHDDLPGLMAAIEELRLGQVTSLAYEHRISTADGTHRWFVCRGLAVPGGGAPAKRVVGSLTDITERRLLEERLRHQALHDGLTGLPNRTLFLDRLSQAIATAKRRPESSYAVLWLDLDGFKVLNDSLGHAFGDKLLVQVADRVRAHVRETDTAARFGGDEFALLLLGVDDLAVIGALARRLLDHLNEPYDLDGHRVVATASIGIATSATRYLHPEDVLRDADIAMYKAKAHERGSFATFDTSMHALAMDRLKIETELRAAIELGQLELHYQPVVDLATSEVKGFEALVRWRKPGGGLVAPLNFLGVAEESGLIVPLGNWVQATAWRQLAAWQGTGAVGGRVRMAVNLSNREFWNPRLLEQVDRVLAQTAVDPACVVIEITEGVIMSNLANGLGVLQGLHDRGVVISVDDFGTGYSSLEALHRLPIDTLKIDRSFVANLGESSRAAELARTIIQMGRNLGLRVIAEGIETDVQRRVLCELNCSLGQGYFFSRPRPAPELHEFLAAPVPGNLSLQR